MAIWSYLDDPVPYGGNNIGILDYLDKYRAQNEAWKATFAPKYRDYKPELSQIQKDAAATPQPVLNEVARQDQRALQGIGNDGRFGFDDNPTSQVEPGEMGTGWMGDTPAYVGAGIGLLTGMPGMGLAGSALGAYNDFSYGQKLADSYGYNFEPSWGSALGRGVSFGLFGQSPREQFMSQMQPQMYQEYADTRMAAPTAEQVAQQNMNAALDAYYSGDYGNDGGYGLGGFDSNTDGGFNSGYDNTGFDSNNDTGFGASY